MKRIMLTRPGHGTFAVIVAAFLITACGGSDSTSPPPSGPTITASSSLTFSPASLTVNAGDIVTFVFGSVGHNVFFDATAGAPANIEGTNANKSVTRTFATAGSFHYTCHIHAGMQGTVTVR